MPKSKQSYIDALEAGQLIAFKNCEKMISAKVLNAVDKANIKVETANGSVYFIDEKDIAWVKTGSRWPKGIYQAFKQQ